MLPFCCYFIELDMNEQHLLMVHKNEFCFETVKKDVKLAAVRENRVNYS